jgi:hypothetical protein
MDIDTLTDEPQPVTLEEAERMSAFVGKSGLSFAECTPAQLREVIQGTRQNLERYGLRYTRRRHEGAKLVLASKERA